MAVSVQVLDDASVYAMLKQIHPDTGITLKAVQQVAHFSNAAAHRLLSIGQPVTVDALESAAVTSLVSGDNLLPLMLREGRRLIDINEQSARKRDTAMYARIENLQRVLGTDCNTAKFLYGMMAYLAEELLDLASDAARGAKCSRIKPCHVLHALSNDTGLAYVLQAFAIDMSDS